MCCYTCSAVTRCVICSNDIAFVAPFTIECSTAAVNGPCVRKKPGAQVYYLTALCGSCALSIEARKESDKQLEQAKTELASAALDMLQKQETVNEALLIHDELCLEGSQAARSAFEAREKVKFLKIAGFNPKKGVLYKAIERFKTLQGEATLATKRHDHAEKVLRATVAEKDGAEDNVLACLSVLADVRADRVTRGYESG